MTGGRIMTKIDIFSGFLGAGKTTLIKKLISEAFQGEKLVLIENEFGEIGIDGGFLKDSGINITEMNSGCICCSLVGDFGTALNEVLEKYAPDRIIIEPSGVGKLSDVIKAVSAVMEDHEDVEMNGYVTVADATKCKMYMKNFGEFYNNQIESAKTIVLSRTGNISDEKLDAALKLIKEKNDVAAIITTPWDQIDGKQILGAIEQSNSLELELLEEEDVCPECGHHHDHNHEHHHHDHEDGHCCGHDHDHDHDHEHHHHDHEDGQCCCGHDHDHDHEHHHHHHADDVFTSMGMETPHKYSEEELTEILKKLSAEGDAYGSILRAKGIVPAVEGEWFHFDLVPGEYEVRRGSADYTGRLCVIGAQLKEEEIKALFHI
jgi:G3E family GTPase